MADVSKLSRGLPTVRLNFSFERTSDGPTPAVLLEVARGSELACSLTLWPEDLAREPGFDAEAIHYHDPGASISRRHWPILRRAITTAMGDDQVLWLELTAPVGHLALLPWEGMLEPIIGSIPIVRIPNFSLLTPAPPGRIDIALCLSEPEAKAPFDGKHLLRRLASSLRLDSSRAVCVHIFTDAPTYSSLRRWLDAGESTPDDIVLHDPAGAPNVRLAAGEAAVTDPAGDVTNPWLLWMIEEMREGTAEIVHFVTHGYLHEGQAALALAESPTVREDPLWARFVGPKQVAACLAQMGAWAVGFTSSQSNFSSLGLWQLFDDVARLRAGPVVHHDAGRDQSSGQLTAAYAGLVAGGPPSFRPAVAMYAHPGLFTPAATTPEAFAGSYAGTIVSNSLTTADPALPEHGWVTSTRRYLEQEVARAFPEQAGPVSEIQRASGQGMQDALKFVDAILRGYEGPQQ